MTKEQLQLEIQVQVKEAIKDLAATSAEVKRMAEEAKKASPLVASYRDVNAKLAGDMKTAATTAKLFGDEVGGLRDKQALLKNALVDLVQAGVNPNVQKMRELKSEYDATTKELERFDEGSQGPLEKLEKMAQLGAQFEMAKKVGEFASKSVEAFAESEAAATRLDKALELRGMDDAKQSFDELAERMQNATGIDGDYIKQLEAEMVAQGKSRDAIERTIVAATGLSSVTGQDLSTSVQQLTMTMSGSAREIGGLIPEIKDLSDEQLRHGAAIDIVYQKYVPFIGKTGETDIALKRMSKSMEDAQKAIGSGFAPAFRLGADILSTFASAVANSGTFMKTVFAAGIAAAGAALVMLAAKTAIMVAVEWKLFAAKQATNIAMAVGNPLIIGAVAAASAAVIGITAYAAAQGKAADVTQTLSDKARAAADDYRGMTEAMKTAADKTKDYVQAAAQVDRLNTLRAQLANLQTQGSSSSSKAIEDLRGVFGILSAKINPKASSWAEGYISDAAKVKAAVNEINRITDKDTVNLVVRSKQVQEAIKNQSSASLREALNSLSTMDPAIQKRIEDIKKEIKSIETGGTIDPPAGSPIDEKAKDWIASWQKAYEEWQASMSKDPVASLDLEKSRKLDEAKSLGLNAQNAKATIDEINAYYASKHQELAGSIARSDAERLAQFSGSQAKVLEVQKANYLATTKDSEAMRVAVVNDFDARITQAKLDDVKKVSDADRKAAEDAFDKAHAAEALEARLSESKVDDLRLQADRELALFQGTAEQKAALEAWYAKQIGDLEVDEAQRAAQAKIEADRMAFENAKLLAQQQGNWGKYAASSAQEAIKDTDVGKLSGAAGGVAVDPMAFLIDKFLEAAMSAESVQKALNAVSTLFAAVFVFLNPFIDDALKPLILFIGQLAPLIGQVLVPFVTSLALQFRLVFGILNATLIPALKLVGAAFTWLNDHVIVPIGNGIIGIINAVIHAINGALGWLGVHIDEIEKLKTSTEIAEQQQRIAAKLAAVNDSMDAVRKTFDDRRQDIEDAYSKNVDAYRKLLEHGAISESAYASTIGALNTQRASDLATLDATEKSQLSVLQGILEKLNSGLDVSVADLAAAGVNVAGLNDAVAKTPPPPPGPTPPPAPETTERTSNDNAPTPGYENRGRSEREFAVGTDEVPTDMTARIHRGEMIVPRSFAEGLRKGEISLGKGGSGRVVNVITNVHVAGSAVAMDALAADLAPRISRGVKRGLIVVDD